MEWEGGIFLAEEIDQLFSNCKLLGNYEYPDVAPISNKLCTEQAIGSLCWEHCLF